MTQSHGWRAPSAPVVDRRTGLPWQAGGGRTTLPAILEATACVLILLLMSNALMGRIGDPQQTGEGAAWLRQMWLPCYAVILLLIAARPAAVLRTWPAAPLIFAVVVWAFLSRDWSLDPAATTRRSIALAAASALGLYLAARYSWRQLVELIALVSVILAAGSLIAVLISPSFGRMQDVYSGAWRGLWFEKNTMGGYMARGALACVCAALMTPSRRLAWSGGAVLCAFLCLMSTSTTAILAGLIGLTGVCALAFLRRGPAWAVIGGWLFAALAVVFLAILTLAPEIFFEAVGKDATLTGRTGLWEAVLRQADKVPWTGYGYGAFWGDKTGPALLVRQEVQWNVHNADNAWMQLRIETGLIGMWLVAMNIAVGAAAAVRSLWRGPESYWAVMFLILLGLVSISESILARPNDTTWVLFVATFTKLLMDWLRPGAAEDR
jgi:exopolysaccharide production protein ExoQ